MEKIQHHVSRNILKLLNPLRPPQYTTPYAPGSVEKLSPPSTNEGEGLDRSSGNTAVPLRSNESREHGLQINDSQAKPQGTRQQTQAQATSTQRRTRSNLQGVTENGSLNDSTLLSPHPNIRDTPASASTRKRTRSSQVGPEPVPATPSQSATTDPEQDSEGPRRSGRKKRKISNYTKHIDVGAETSGNENE